MTMKAQHMTFTQAMAVQPRLLARAVFRSVPISAIDVAVSVMSALHIIFSETLANVGASGRRKHGAFGAALAF